MKHSISRTLLTLISILVLFALLPVPGIVQAQDETPTSTPTVTNTPTVTSTPTQPAPTVTEAPPATVAPLPEVIRPLVVIDTYWTDNEITPGKTFDLGVTFKNKGKEKASNLIAVFESADFLPLETGGVRALVSLDTGKDVSVTQPWTAPAELWGKSTGSVTVKLTYTDQAGVPMAEMFVLTLGIQRANWAAVTSTPTPTPTAPEVLRPQVVVAGYKSDINPLQPGSVFNLELEIHNLGNADAKAVTMVLGGGANVDFDGGTPQPGGISGGSSDLSVFAPLGSSNLFYVGDIDRGGSFKGLQQLIVNVSAAPGAYPLKLSFVYTDEKGSRIVDAQVITLLVFQLPQVEVSFYRDPGMLMAGQPNQLPVQVTNLGRKPALLGNMIVTCENSEVSNNVSLVGALDPGMYYTLDPMMMPGGPGTYNCEVTISYTDDFNQSRTINQSLSVEVQDAPPPPEMGPGMEGMPPVDMGMQPENETFWQKVARFFKGLLGLNSAPETQEPPMEGPMGPEGPVEEPMPVKGMPPKG